MSKIVPFRKEKVLLKRAEDAYDAVMKAGDEVEVSIHSALIDLVELPFWNISGFAIALIKLLKSSRRLRKLSIYRDSLCEIGYTLGYIKGRKDRYKRERR